ncbi:MAG: alanine:cation symporter family protein [Bacteroidota bacterium]|nr:alanine:cation symporter family protein [Bacteroidota bacterium]
MKKLLLCLFFYSLGIIPTTFAQEIEVTNKTVDQKINDAIAPATQVISDLIFFSFPVSEEISVPFILIWLMLGAIIFTVYLKFVNLTGFRHAIDIVKGKYTHQGDPGEVTHFQALTAALSGTVGLGNIAGVAIAISLGGPGATFWMIIAGFFGMTSKFVECTLAVKFRNIDAKGVVFGGPMYYLSKGLSEKGMKGFGAFLAAFFALMCIGGSFGAGNMFQINQAANQLLSLPFLKGTYLAESAWIVGVVMAILVASVIIGGIKSIARVTEKIVPFMCILYIIGAFVVIFANIENLGGAFAAILKGAFSGTAVAGGIVGVLIQGVRRAAFSNEAGIGSAAIAHSAVKTSEPVTEGFVASLEPFVDTVVVCTMTALVIVITDAYTMDTGDGIQLTSFAFATVVSWFPYLLSIAVVLFAFSTMISWSYYGLKSWTYLFGVSKFSDYSFKFIFCLFIVIGSSLNLGSVVDFSDAMIFAMSFPNLIGLYILAPLVKKDMISFISRVKKGKIETYDYNE